MPSGMLPRNHLGRKMLGKLKIYSGEEHPHRAQQPSPLSFDAKGRLLLPKVNRAAAAAKAAKPKGEGPPPAAKGEGEKVDGAKSAKGDE